MSQAWIDFLHLIFSMVCLYICVFVHFAGLWLQELLKEALKFSQDVPYKSVHVYCVHEFHWIPWCSHNDIVYTHLLRGEWDMIVSAFCIYFVPFRFHPSIYLCMYLGKTFPKLYNFHYLQVALNERPRLITEAETIRREANTTAQIILDKANSDARILQTR